MFDPSEFTVKDARLRLSELDLDGLEAVLKSEIDGKHRSSLMADIGRAIDSIKTAEDKAPAAAAPKVAPEKRTISVDQWARLNRNDRKCWAAFGGTMVEK